MVWYLLLDGLRWSYKTVGNGPNVFLKALAVYSIRHNFQYSSVINKFLPILRYEKLLNWRRIRCDSEKKNPLAFLNRLTLGDYSGILALLASGLMLALGMLLGEVTAANGLYICFDRSL